MSTFPLSPAPSNRAPGDTSVTGDNNDNAKAIAAINDYLGDPAGRGLSDGDLLVYDAVNNRLVPAAGGITTTDSRTLYVATTGSDTTGDGTSANPFRTIQHAVDVARVLLPQANIGINIAAGAYNEDVEVNQVLAGGTFNIVGDTANPGSVEFGSLLVRNVRATNIRAAGVMFTKDRTATPYNYTYGVIALNSSLVEVSNCAWSAGPSRGIDVEFSLAYVLNNDFGTDNVERAIVANKGGHIISRSNTGNATLYGLWAVVGGTLAKYDTTQPTGTNLNEYSNAGGSIWGP